MAFCSNCGTEVAGAAFCPKCGQAQTGPPVVHTSASTQPGMAENVAALLSYVLGWVTGIIFLLIDKRPFVRFHAAQSIVVFGGLTVIRIAIGLAFGVGSMAVGLGAFGLMTVLEGLVSIVGVVLWILLMVKAYQGEQYEVPIAAGIARSLIGK